MTNPICRTCKDTHQIWSYRSECYQGCTSCPVPCQRCRAGGIGAYCGSTPCDCSCHIKKPAPPYFWENGDIKVLTDKIKRLEKELLTVKIERDRLLSR